MLDFNTLIGSVAAFCTTVSFVPQAVQTIKTKNTKGISLAMYSIFAMGTIFWLYYGIIVVSYPMIIANTITASLAVIILIYKIKYK